MNDDTESTDNREGALESDEPRRRMRLPPIIKPDDRGIGDVIARMAQSTGIAPCDGCLKRQNRLNQWMPFRKP